MNLSKTSPRYIVIEGNDGTGKSTQVELLRDHLLNQGIDSFVMHEPAGTPMADAIRTIIKDGELPRNAATNLLLFTAARHELWHTALSALEEGKWVISARNYLSTEVYQGIGEGLDIELIHTITRQFTDERYMSPDTTIVLTLSDIERERRIKLRGPLDKKDTFESRDQVFQDALNNGYQTLANRYGYATIDASADVESVQEKIRSIIFAA